MTDIPYMECEFAPLYILGDVTHWCKSKRCCGSRNMPGISHAPGYVSFEVQAHIDRDTNSDITTRPRAKEKMRKLLQKFPDGFEGFKG